MSDPIHQSSAALRQSCAVMKHSHLYVKNDAGPTHLTGREGRLAEEHEEQFDHEKTVFIVPPGSAEGVAKRMGQQLAQNAAAEAVKWFSLAEQVEHYLSWYQEILERDPVCSVPI